MTKFATIPQLLALRAQEQGDRPYIFLGETHVSYLQLAERADDTAAGLSFAGVHAGECVGILMANCLEYLYNWFGVLRAGAIAVPLNPGLTPEEISHVLRDAGIRTLIVDAERVAVVSALPPLDRVFEKTVPRQGDVPPMPDDPSTLAALMYTSGTTGQPKGVELTHRNYLVDALMAQQFVEITGSDRFLSFLPLHHVHAQVASVLVPMLAGAQTVMIPKFDPATFLNDVARYKATCFSAIPAMLAILLAMPNPAEGDLTSLRFAMCGSAPLSVEVFKAFERRFNIRILEGYGLTEGTCVSTANPPGGPWKIGTIGLPMPPQEMRIVDEDCTPVPDGQVGEIVLRGENIMRGYYRNPQATAEAIRNGWLHTGDLGSRDSDGYFTVVGRRKDMIIWGGMNVFPKEIEEALQRVPGVMEVFVVGIPDPVFGEEIVAVVVPRPNATVTEESVVAAATQYLAPYKRPRRIVFRNPMQMPRTSTGKVQKHRLREALTPKSESEVLFLTSQWERAAKAGAVTHRTGSYLVIGEGSPLGPALISSLMEKGASAVLSRSVTDGAVRENLPLLGVVYLASPDAVESCRAVVEITQKLLKADPRTPPRLWIVTEGLEHTAALAPVWALARTLAIEHGPLRPVRIDLAAGNAVRHAAQLAAEILADGTEEEVAYRKDGRYIGRLISNPVPAITAGWAIKPDGTYLVSGVYSGGLDAEAWLRKQGAHHVVTLTAAEASDRNLLAAALEQIANTIPPLRGVIHSMEPLDDKVLAAVTACEIHSALAPRIEAARNLAELTLNINLDLFLVNSSIASLLGSPGQGIAAAAHAGVDAVAHERKVRGLPVVTINWSALSIGDGAGAKYGSGRLTESLASELLSALAATGAVETGVVPLNIRQWLAFYPEAAGHSRLAHLIQQAAEPVRAGMAPFRQALSDADPGMRPGMIERLVRDQIARVLEVDASLIRAETTLMNLGLDSLRGLELRNRLETALGTTLPATLMWTYPTLQALSQHLIKEIIAEPEMSDDEVVREMERKLAALEAGV